MGIVLQEQGKLEEAMKMYQKSLEMNKKTLGEEHSSVADTYNKMGVLLHNQGKLEKKMKIPKKCLEISKKTLVVQQYSLADLQN